MTRRLKSKLLYVVLLALLGGVALATFLWSPFGNQYTLLAMVLVLLTPGWIQRFVFRDHYRGRQLLEAGRPEEALESCDRFLRQIRAQPWRKQLIYLAWGVYTWDVEAMTLNNMGSALLALERFDDSRSHLEKAVSIDPEYAVPRFNLAVLAAARRDRDSAEAYLQEAESLGYRCPSVESVIQLAEAAVQGRGNVETT